MSKISKHGYMIELSVKELSSGNVIKVDTFADFFNMEETNRVEVVHTFPKTKQPNGRTKTEIVFGKGIYTKDDIV